MASFGYFPNIMLMCYKEISQKGLQGRVGGATTTPREEKQGSVTKQEELFRRQIHQETLGIRKKGGKKDKMASGKAYRRTAKQRYTTTCFANAVVALQ